MFNSLVVAADVFVIVGENGVVLHATKVIGQVALQKCPQYNRTRLRIRGSDRGGG